MTTAPYLAKRVLAALLREDVGGLSKCVADGHLILPGGRVVALGPPGLFVDHTVVDDDLTMTDIDEILADLADGAVGPSSVADPEGAANFLVECRETAVAVELAVQARDDVLSGLANDDVAFYDVLAAYLPHPVYPLSAGRLGMAEADILRYAPEHAPQFALRWASYSGPVELSGDLPTWWPSPAEVGTADGVPLFPVHPLTLGLLPETARLAPRPYLTVRPTLSLRTVVPIVDPGVQLKIPLPVRTLGWRNRRSITAGTLVDGATAQRLLEPLTGDRVRLADEQTFGESGHEYLAYLVRRMPPGGATVPVAALLAPSPDGRPVIAEFADRHYGSEVEAFLADYLEVLFDWNVRLLVRGIALEAHQQNLGIRFDQGRLTLIVKDNDSLRCHFAPGRVFRDQRLITGDPAALTDLFVTITLHLAAAAVTFGAADLGLIDVSTARRLIAGRLTAALARYEAVAPGPIRALGDATLRADRLIGKSMLTAGTLAARNRVGVADINKHYAVTGPNYLRDGLAGPPVVTEVPQPARSQVLGSLGGL